MVSRPIDSRQAATRPGTDSRSLAEPQLRLLRLMQSIRYGRIGTVTVRDGLPVFDQPISWTRTVKVAGDNAPHPLSATADFALRREVTDFFALLAEVGDGTVRNIEVRNGLPFTFEVDGATRP